MVNTRSGGVNPCLSDRLWNKYLFLNHVAWTLTKFYHCHCGRAFEGLPSCLSEGSKDWKHGNIRCGGWQYHEHRRLVSEHRLGESGHRLVELKHEE